MKGDKMKKPKQIRNITITVLCVVLLGILKFDLEMMWIIIPINTFIIDPIKGVFVPAPPFNMRLIKSKNIRYKMELDGNTPEYWTGSTGQEVEITKNFYMDCTEVTQYLFDSVMSKRYSFYKTPDWTIQEGLVTQYPAYDVT